MNSNKIKENKYKILRMSLILGSDDDRTETLNNFEEAAREIDAMNDEIYLRDLEEKFYDTVKLEEEEEKLAKLVDYIGGRVEQRISLLSDFANVTGYDLDNLPPIKYYDKLDDYKDRLRYIREYLQNTNQINSLNQEINEYENQLKDAYLSKATSAECNTRNEEILLNKFKNIIKTIPQLKEVAEENLETKLDSIIQEVSESKKSLDIFDKSFATLSSSGISYEEEQEYKSYVDNAKELYYQNKEQEYLLRLYRCLLIKKVEYNEILEKRQQINTLLFRRLDLRKELNITTSDVLSPLYDLLEKQFNEIEIQKGNIDKIEFLNKNIESKKEKLNELEQANQKVEILSLLREFCLIDTYVEPVLEEQDSSPIPEVEQATSSETISTSSINFSSDPQDTKTPSPTEQKVEEPIMPKIPQEKPKDNEVILVENATDLDLDLIHAKADKVMKRVGEMLGIKTEETQIISISNEEPPISRKELPKVEQSSREESEFQSLPAENPLFSNNLSETKTEVEPEREENSFWFPSDTPDALNELPDLNTVSDNNFFTNNNIPNLNFPDLKIDFGNNDSEERS